MDRARPIQVDHELGCWLWAGDRSSDGYGLIGRQQAHRVVYQERVGAIPEGLVLDHLCRRPACVAPHHLEPVTKAENERRKRWPRRARRARCQRGHDLELHAVITPEGGKVCRCCNREASRP